MQITQIFFIHFSLFSIQFQYIPNNPYYILLQFLPKFYPFCAETRSSRSKFKKKGKTNMEKTLWGKAEDGSEIFLYTLHDKSNADFSVSFTNIGGSIVNMTVPVEGEGTRDVVLGHADATSYFANPNCYGAPVMRHANRIGEAKFTLNGKTYELETNDGKNNLHSGTNSLHHRFWEVAEVSDDSITFTYHSPAGDMGYPGNMDIRMTYTLKDKALIIDYSAVCDEDSIFNPTNHSYFNLKGHGNGTILDHKLTLFADEMTIAGPESIPLGEKLAVEGTPFDFRNGMVIGDHIFDEYEELRFPGGYDHNFVLRKTDAEITDQYEANGKKLSKAALLEAPDGKLSMTVYTDLPGIQLYCGNMMANAVPCKGGKDYEVRGGLCLETQFFPNAINVPAFDQPVIKKDETFATRTVYAF